MSDCKPHNEKRQTDRSSKVVIKKKNYFTRLEFACYMQSLQWNAVDGISFNSTLLFLKVSVIMTEEDNKYTQKESPSITDGGESKGGSGGGANQKHNRGGLSICGGRNRTGGGSVPIPKLTFKGECRVT